MDLADGLFSKLKQIDGAFSEFKPVKTGVPQGSLGSLLPMLMIFQTALEVAKFTCMQTTLLYIPLVTLLMRLL